MFKVVPKGVNTDGKYLPLLILLLYPMKGWDVPNWTPTRLKSFKTIARRSRNKRSRFEMIRLWDSLRKVKECQPYLGSDNASIPVCNIVQDEVKFEIRWSRVEEGRNKRKGITEIEVSFSSSLVVVSSTEAIYTPSNSNASSPFVSSWSGEVLDCS